MRDGVGLATDVHQPDTSPNSAGLTFLLRTPYGKAGSFDAVAEVAQYLTSQGHTIVAQDVRGKFASEGKCTPFAQELNDGADTVSWLAQQEWCTGRIVPTGESYCGFTALTAAASGHSSVVAVMAGMTTTYVASDWLNCDDVFRLHLNTEWITMAFGFSGLPADQPWNITDWWDVTDLEQLDTGTADIGALQELRAAAISSLGNETLAGGLKSRAGALAKVPLILWSGFWDPLVRGTVAEFQAAAKTRPTQAHHLELRSTDHLGNPWGSAVRKESMQIDRAQSLLASYDRNFPRLVSALQPNPPNHEPRVSIESQTGEKVSASTWPVSNSTSQIAYFSGPLSIPAAGSLPDLPDSGESFVWGTLAANFPAENSTADRSDVLALPFDAQKITGDVILSGSVQWNGAQRIIATVAQEQPDGRLLRVVEGVASRCSSGQSAFVRSDPTEKFTLDLGPSWHRDIYPASTDSHDEPQKSRWWLLLMQEHYPRYLPAAESTAWLPSPQGSTAAVNSADINVFELRITTR